MMILTHIILMNFLAGASEGGAIAAVKERGRLIMRGVSLRGV